MSDIYEESDWRALPWSEAYPGQRVWLRGTHVGQFRAYGAHLVEDVQRRLLRSGTPSRRGQVFVHVAEDLLVPVKEGEDG